MLNSMPSEEEIKKVEFELNNDNTCRIDGFIGFLPSLLEYSW